MVKIAINGFGRIGRDVFKIAFERHDAEIVAINDLSTPHFLSHLLKYDSTYGIYNHEVSANNEHIIVNNKKIPFFSEANPQNLPWKKLDVDVVIECTGAFTDPAKASSHIASGAKKVVISAPANSEDVKTIVLGVNEDAINSSDEIVSNASCTTNCVAPIIKILEEHFGIEKVMMTTVHSYIPSQRLLDKPAKNLRESRSAAENIIPTSTDTPKNTTLAIPSLAGKITGLSIRVPTSIVSLSDITAVIKKDTTKEEINEIFRQAAKEPFYQGILGVSEAELVSSDFRGDAHSCIIDLPLTNVVGGNLIKIVAWYDNEWGYSNRLVELATDFGKEK